MPNPENLKPFTKGHMSHEEAAARGHKGGKKSGETRSLTSYLKKWANSPCSSVDQTNLESRGFGEAATKKATILLPLLQNVKKGDVKSIRLVLEMLGEDNKLKAELKVLKQQNEVLKLQAKKLELELLNQQEKALDTEGIEIQQDTCTAVLEALQKRTVAGFDDEEV